MGLHTNRIIRLMQILNRDDVKGSICMLGVQQIYINWEDFSNKAKRFDITFDQTIYKQISGIYPIDTYAFFRMLGFSEVHALDASDYEDADIIMNLNEPCTDNLYDKFDVILDGGTLEHVFDIATAMKSLCKMLKNNGIVIHISPLSGYVDHGFYSLSPTFYLDFYQKNGYEVVCSEIEFVMDRGQNQHEKWNSLYSQDCRLFDDWFNEESSINEYVLSVAKMPEVRRILLWFAARKKGYAQEICYPMQSMWKQFENDNNRLSE